MNFDELQDHIRYLESLDEADAPMINCYLNLGAPYRNNFGEQVRSTTAGLPLEMRASFWEILGRIEVFLGTCIQPETKGVAIFARWGNSPVFLPLQFDTPMPTKVMVRPVPNISPLLELRDAMVCLVGNQCELGVGHIA